MNLRLLLFLVGLGRAANATEEPADAGGAPEAKITKSTEIAGVAELCTHIATVVYEDLGAEQSRRTRARLYLYGKDRQCERDFGNVYELVLASQETQDKYGDMLITIVNCFMHTKNAADVDVCKEKMKTRQALKE